MDESISEIINRIEVGPETVAVRLETPAGFDARPGQFVQVRRVIDGEPVTRHYSISSPEVGEDFELTVGVDPEGTLSPWLASATPGDTVGIDGPFGRVYYENEPRVTVFAAGPGIGAAVGIAERARLESAECTVVYEPADGLVHEDRLAALSSGCATVFVIGDGDTGRLRGLVKTAVGESELFVYGFEPFVERVTAAIEAVGGDPFDANVEIFG